jgi:hypothetical protein
MPPLYGQGRGRALERRHAPAGTQAAHGASELEVYHALAQADYVNVLCLHVRGELVVVRQYRPIIDRWTDELPSGLRDADEPAEEDREA